MTPLETALLAGVLLFISLACIVLAFTAPTPQEK